ncbi:MAG: UvrD-helicase domain-containing protein, partial [Chromatiales bacterium]
MSLEAAAPGRNATVFASAGSGKTWLLVTRMLRLLLAGARPGGILAITFTRKAAGEMRARLLARLRDWACAEPETLAHMLEAIGVEPDAAAVRRARGLYETILFDPQPMRMTTFHAFCQDVLRRFPLEAAVPPGFELLEATGELRARAWDALFAEATREPDAETAAALQALFDGCRGLDNTRRALDGFLEHRGDWWAYTEDRPDPVGHASARLAEYLQVDAESQPEAELIAAEASALQRFGELLRRHPTATNLGAAETLDAALAPQTASEDAFRLAWAVFFTGAGQPRKRKASATQARRMGAEGEQEFLGLHQRLVRALQKARSVIAAMQTLATNQAWLRAGARYLSHYERLKAELRLLDFTDLEWRSYRLLNHADNALWVQYKLDARIDHLLIDEFQDTNPTQWRLILPLLEELAAGESERGRSVFLVGDPKQSIYAFRRAKPELQDTAADWLDQHLGARRQGLDKSWRSAPVIMQLVNEVFTSTALADRIVGFPHHDTHRQELWGRVELLPLAIPPESEPESAPSALRDPLAEPRTYDPNSAQLAEGRLIAERIASLIRSRTPIQAGDGIRPVGYDDIVILMRGRTHAAAIERALREAKIPYSGIERGTLLDALEVQDLVALLQLLTAPHDDLALAQVLRSPIFDATDDDLIRLARTSGRSWMERLERVAIEEPTEAPLARAWRMLADWRSRAGSLPIHDLL